MIDAISSVFILVCADSYKPEDAPHVIGAIADLDDLSAEVTVKVAVIDAQPQAKENRN